MSTRLLRLNIDWDEVRRKREEFWKSSPAYRVMYEILKKQGYHLIGTIGAVKRCYWTKEALVRRRFCYKCLWYGIESHRCIQMTPVVAWCWHRCLHCWRLQPEDIGMYWDETKPPVIDDPEILIEESILEFRKIISGFKGNPNVSKEMYEEAMNPNQAAISLTGEPILYPRIGELIQEYKKRGFSTFLVTRGPRPDVLANLETEPSQLYISMEAWNKNMYLEFNRPIVPRAWELFLKTIELIPSFKCPTVFRITVIRGFNMREEDVDGFAKLVEKGNPTYVEVKAYMYMGRSRGRLSSTSMPTHEEVREFAKKLAEKIGYKVLSESIPSRIVLLSRIDKPIRHGKGCPGGVEHPEKWCAPLTHEYEEAKD